MKGAGQRELAAPPGIRREPGGLARCDTSQQRAVRFLMNRLDPAPAVAPGVVGDLLIPPGSAYDPNFYGGIDEVIPGDLPETIAGIENPDHGELWTLALDAQIDLDTLVLHGQLPQWGLHYTKRVSLQPGTSSLHLDYRIQNNSGQQRIFLWKLHAALEISPGDRLICPAELAVAADPHWSRWHSPAPFAWPLVEGQRADIIPAPNGTTDFLYLYGLWDGLVGLQSRERGCQFTIRFDPVIFPYVCYFASYGGFDGHYTAVLEPCTAMPLSVNEAARLNQCSVLAPGEQITTRITIEAGPIPG
jgi:hypothetical protein